MKDYLNYITSLEYDEEPDYELVRKLFKASLKKISCTDDGASIIMPQQSVSFIYLIFQMFYYVFKNYNKRRLFYHVCSELFLGYKIRNQVKYFKD